MAKNLLFALFFCTPSFVFSTISAANEPGHLESKTFPAEVCEAPVPDSFRVTSVSGTFIALAWHPAWLGATHELSVSEKDEFGGWTTQYIFPDVPGSFFTVENLESGKEYRFRIATKCPSGDPSELTAIVDDHTVIIELTLIGRNPKNPTEINGQGIQYQNYNWLGFKVSGEGESNIFEVNVNEGTSGDNDPIAFIRRVYNANPIVAVDPGTSYPNGFNPIIPEVPVPFRIVRLLQAVTLKDIGYVKIAKYNNIPPTIDLLIEDQFPWKNSYTFTVIVAKETISIPQGGTGQGFVKDPSSNTFTVQNPFKDNLVVFTPLQYAEQGICTMRLLNTQGITELEQKLEPLNTAVSFPIEWLPPGIYFLQIETGLELQVLKVVKSE